jgi:hypothetical protein
MASLRIRAALLALAPLLASCDRATLPVERAEDQLVFLRAAPGAPPLAALHAQFWAVAGVTRQVEIRYVNQGVYAGDKCLEFTVPGNALLALPDGHRVQPGDSVLITVDVPDPNAFRFEFQPAGLRFDPSHPAQMRVSYKWVDPEDAARARDFAVWRREAPGEPWARVPTSRAEDAQEVMARVDGFSQYALAGGHRSSPAASE